MKRTFLLSCGVVALLFLVPLVTVIAPPEGNLLDEGRRREEFPAGPERWRAKEIRKYFRQIDAWYADHFPLRSPLLALAQELRIGATDSSQCYSGKEDWLFLGNGQSRIIEKLQGTIALSGPQIESQTAYYRELATAAEAHGATFVVLIGSDKSTIYPEYLPGILHPASTRYIEPLLAALKDAGIATYDPTDDIIRAKHEALLYYRTDTHWNARGAYAAFEGLRALLGAPALPPFTWEEDAPQAGDLVRLGGFSGFPLHAGDTFRPVWPDGSGSSGGQNGPQWIREMERLPTRLPVEPAVQNAEFAAPQLRGLEISNPGAPDGRRVWVFGDSFTGALKPYFSAEFREVWFFDRQAWIVYGDITRLLEDAADKPDIIVWEVVERQFGD